MRDYLFLFINGLPHEVRGDQAFCTLSDYLRYHHNLIGTKIVCAEGDCGACTVLIGRIHEGDIDYHPVNSCIQQVHQLDGCHVITVEGLTRDGELNAVQESMVACHGAQCGFCTPGFITSLTALFEQTKTPNQSAVREALAGNLCRCTGYEPIIAAALATMGESMKDLNHVYPSRAMVGLVRENTRSPVRVDTKERLLYMPDRTEDAVAFFAENPDAVIVQGGTDVGVQCNKRGLVPRAILRLNRIEGMERMEETDETLVIGGSVRLSTLEKYFEKKVPQFHRILSWFGSPQIRAVGTLAGNVVNGSPIADTLPFLYVMEARVELVGPEGTRMVGIDDFYCGYKNLNRKPGEIVAAIHLPLPASDETIRLYKISKRRDMDISTFTAGIRMRISDQKMSGVRVAYGGVGPTVLRLPGTEALLEGATISEEIFTKAGETALGEINPIDDVRGSAHYRNLLGRNIWKRFYHESCPEVPMV